MRGNGDARGSKLKRERGSRGGEERTRKRKKKEEEEFHAESLLSWDDF